MENFDLTLNEMYNKALPLYGDKTAIEFSGEKTSYEQLNRQANRLAHGLIHSGLEVEDPVALLMSNCAEYIISDIAIMKAGLVKVPLNDMLREKDILYMLQDSKAKAVIVGPNFYPIISKIRSVLPSLQVIVGLSERVPEGFIRWDTFLTGVPDTNPVVDIKPSQMATLAYSGGTTGQPKGIVQTQQNLVMNMFNHLLELELTERDKILLSSPLPHAAGKMFQAGLLKGSTHLITERFDAVNALELIEQERITTTLMVPTMLYRLFDAIEQHDFDISSVQTIVYVASPMTEKQLKRGLGIFGPVFLQLYGQSEAPNLITRLTKVEHSLDSDKVHRLRSCGRATMMSEVKILNAEGQTVPPHEQGEIVVKSPYVMERYHNLPEKTAETIIDGWLHTGDIGKMDEDGYVYLLDRKNDMIITGGMNVYSAEVENVIQQCPGVSQVAVIGVPHDDWGEQVVAHVIPTANANLSTESISRFCEEHLSKYKRPKQIKLVAELPLTQYGKLDKKMLRKSYWREAERAVN